MGNSGAAIRYSIEMNTLPHPADQPTPGTSTTPTNLGDSSPPKPTWWLWIAFFAVLTTVVVMQRPEPTDPAASQNAGQGLGVVPPPSTQMMLVTKLLLATKDVPGYGPLMQGMIDQAAGWEPESASIFSPKPLSRSNPPKARATPGPAAERIRAAIVAGETLKSDDIAWRLEDAEKSLAKDSPLIEDITSLRTLYALAPAAQTDASGDAQKSEPASRTLDALAIAGLKQRHGLFAELALTHADAKPDSTPDTKAQTKKDATPSAPAAPDVRARAASEGILLVAILAIAGGIIALAFLAGLVILVIGLINLRKLRKGMTTPQPASEWPVDLSIPARSVEDQLVAGSIRASSVWLETVVIFILGFLCIKLLDLAMHAIYGDHQPSWGIAVPLGAQWLLVSAIFWPVVRGMSWQRWRGEIGWHTGRGVLREIGAGLVAYLAMLPIYFFMALIVVLITLGIGALRGGEAPLPEGNKVIDIVQSGNPLVLVAIFLLATLWAPIVEESIFRGAFFRHLRGRLGLALSAFLSAMAFAVMHGYAVQGLVMVGTLGVAFALVREWRGSLIATATAHAVHNGFVLTLLMTILSLAS